jgi:signal transduction histidine kinase
LRRYEQLIDLSRRLNAVLELPRVLQTVVEAAQEMTGSAASSILLIDPRSGNLFFEAATGSKRDEIQRYVVPMDNSIAGWVVEHGEPVTLDDAQQDARHFRQSDIETAFTTGSLLAVPLSVKGHIIGVLEVLNKMDEQPYDEDDVNLLVTMADQAAVAIENARLFQQGDLVSQMVHELRTPLTVILSYADLLLGDPVSEEQRIQYLETLRDEAERLTNMISDFLDLARLSSGRARIARSEVQLVQLIRAVVSAIRPQALESGVRIWVRAPQDLPPVRGDEARLRQVIMNLLSNAVKYNRPDGRVTVTVGVDTDDDRYLCVAVKDTGCGIPEEHLQHLFEKFFRVEGAEDYARGAGLGLSIAKQIVQVHGGQISVHSQPDVGSTFSFTIPVFENEG